MAREFARLISQFIYSLPHLCRQSAAAVFYGLVLFVVVGLSLKLWGKLDD